MLFNIRLIRFAGLAVYLMPRNFCSGAACAYNPAFSQGAWRTFEDILRQLHAEGVYIHSEQLAEFLLFHGLPVHLRYVPPHLKHKATQINQHYQGDMAQLIEESEYEQPY